MTVEDNTNNQYKNPSEILINLMDQFSNVELSRGELIQQIMERAKLEDIPTDQIRRMIVERLKAKGLSQSTINRAIPLELKDTKMQAVRSHRQEYASRQTQEIEEPKTIEYVPKPEIPTPQEQEYIKQVVPETVVPQVPIADKDMTLEQLRERNRQRYLSAQTQQQTNQQSTKIGSIKTVYPVLLMRTEKGEYEVVLTVRIDNNNDKATVDPVHRADLRKINSVPTIKT